MTSAFGSFSRSALGAFVQSSVDPHGRGTAGAVVITGATVDVVTLQNLKIGRFDLPDSTPQPPTGIVTGVDSGDSWPFTGTFTLTTTLRWEKTEVIGTEFRTTLIIGITAPGDIIRWRYEVGRLDFEGNPLPPLWTFIEDEAATLLR